MWSKRNIFSVIFFSSPHLSKRLSKEIFVNKREEMSMIIQSYLPIIT